MTGVYHTLTVSMAIVQTRSGSVTVRRAGLVTIVIRLRQMCLVLVSETVNVSQDSPSFA